MLRMTGFVIGLFFVCLLTWHAISTGSKRDWSYLAFAVVVIVLVRAFTRGRVPRAH